MCLNPIPAKITRRKNKQGIIKEKIHFFKAKDFEENRKEDIIIPCGHCIECLMSKKKRMKNRIIYEMKRNIYNYFITLTYKNNPKELIYKDVQLFIKKLRRSINCENLKYFVVGEYGEKTKRPHWHMILSGVSLEYDNIIYKMGTNGAYYNNKTITEAWGRGYAVICRASEATAAYVSSYVLKKAENKVIGRASIGYGIDTETNELYRSDGTPLTRQEKEILRKKNQEEYYKKVDEYREKIKNNEEAKFKKILLAKRQEKNYNKIIKKRGVQL